MSDPYRSSEVTGTCPRCHGKTEIADRWNALACIAGCGEWYPKETLDQILAWRSVETQSVTDDGQRLVTSWPWGRARCPQCRAEMAIGERAELRFDYCSLHGIWLDAGEIERFARVFGLA
jgi:TFIIB-like protein